MPKQRYFAALCSSLEQMAGSATTPLAIADRLLNEGSQLIVGDSDNFEAILSAAKDAWDKFVVPINIPQIPDVIEPALEKAAWAAIEAGLRAVHTRFHAAKNAS